MRLPIAAITASLALSVFFPFYWYNQTYLSKFTWQLVALLILLFLFHNRFGKKRFNSNPIQIYQNITDVVIITILTILLVLSTGGTGSPLFFLLHFLLFFIAIFTHSRQSFTLSLAVNLGFLLNEVNFTNNSLINLVSLLFMAPLASFFSTQYARLITAKKEIKVLSNQAKKRETATLLWLTLNFHNKIEQSIDLLSQITINLGNIPFHQRRKFNQLYDDLKALFKSGQELKNQVDELTD